MSKWINKGDKVLVIAGNSKGKTGEVLRKSKDRIVVQGVNLRKKHLKRRDANVTSQIVEMEMPIHISNVTLCNESGVSIKIKTRLTEQGKERYYQQGKEILVHRTIKKPAKV
ncbi:MAG: 50S ribosomal protein L24 [Chlamydiales bacterium]